jgi:hypothetical protein
MERLQENRETSFDTGAAVLMARIVDRSGVAIRRSDVAAIEYSIVERQGCRRENFAWVPGRMRIGLCVDEVLFDWLEVGVLWTLDVCGYNFRHEIDLGKAREYSKSGTSYEILYMFTTTFGEKIAIRFELGALGR